VDRKPEIIGEYMKARGIPDDPFPKLIEAKAAHVAESQMILVFRMVWVVLLVITLTTVGYCHI